MPNITLTNAQARRFVLSWQGLWGASRFAGAAGALAFVWQAGCLQFDPVDLCGKNAELVLFSRVKGFKKQMLHRLLYKDRALVDHWDKNMSLYPAENWPHFARNRARFRGWSYSEESRREVLDGCDAVRAYLKENSAASSLDIDLGKQVDWPWGPTGLSRAVLEYLYFTGEVVIEKRQGTRRIYAPAEAHLPTELLAAPDPHPADADYYAWHTLRRIGAAGLLWNRPSDTFLAIPEYTAPVRNAAFEALLADGRILPCAVEGLAAPLYFPAAALPLMQEVLAGGPTPKAPARLEFIAPLDSFIWDRKLIRALFGFDYTWEIYTPKAKRKYGPYVLPVLDGTAFAGRIQLLADRTGKVLTVAGFWPEKGMRGSKAFRARLHRRLLALTAFNGCETLAYAPDCGLTAP